MTKFIINIVINQPLDVVVKALMNPDNFIYWTTNLVKFEIIKRKPGEVGSIAYLHYSEKGCSYIMEDKLIYCEPGKKYISQVTGDALFAEVETILQPLGKKTEMCLKWFGKGKVFLLKLLLPLLKSKIIKHAKIDLEKFKRLVETKGANFKSDDSF